MEIRRSLANVSISANTKHEANVGLMSGQRVMNIPDYEYVALH